MSMPKSSGPIQIKIKMQNPSLDPPVSSEAPNQDFDDIDNLDTFKIKIEAYNLEHGFVKDQWPYTYQDQDTKPQPGTVQIRTWRTLILEILYFENAPVWSQGYLRGDFNYN